MLLALLVSVVAPVASGLVYVDAARRGLSRQERLLWASAGGMLVLSGLLLQHRFEDVVTLVYFQNIKPAPVATSPYEVLVLHLSVGITISIVSVLLCGVGIRFRHR